MRRVAVLFTSLCATVLLAQSAGFAAAMLTNGGFETGDFTGWTVGGNAVRGVAAKGTSIPGTDIAGNRVNALSSNFAAYAILQGGASPTSLTLEQTVEVEPGVPYSISFSPGVFGDGGSYKWSPSISVFVDGVSSGPLTGTVTGPAWATLTLGQYVFADTSAEIRFEFGGSATATGGPAAFSLDNLTMQRVPEPTGPAVVFLAAAAALRRRRPRQCLS